jgi:DNA polymerase
LTPLLHENFRLLADEAQSCALCPQMAARTAVLSERNGTLEPKVLFIAEAPGRQGADRTRIPFHGDASGRAFEHLLASVGLTREDIFITNAVMCSPRSETGANRSPTQAEIRNCNSFLRRMIDLLQPPLVVTIGAVALKATDRIEAHGLTLKQDVGRLVKWQGRWLAPLYHPSPQTLISTRSLAQQEADWQAIRGYPGAAVRRDR